MKRASTSAYPGWKVFVLVATDMETYLVCLVCFVGNVFLIFTGVQKSSKVESKIEPRSSKETNHYYLYGMRIVCVGNI